MEFKKGETIYSIHTDVMGTFLANPDNVKSMEDGSGVMLLNKEKNICIKLTEGLRLLKNQGLIIPHARVIYTTEDKLEEPIKCTEEKDL